MTSVPVHRKSFPAMSKRLSTERRLTRISKIDEMEAKALGVSVAEMFTRKDTNGDESTSDLSHGDEPSSSTTNTEPQQPNEELEAEGFGGWLKGKRSLF